MSKQGVDPLPLPPIPTLAEVRDAMWFVTLSWQKGWMAEDEADRWRRHLLICKWLLEQDDEVDD